MRSEAEHRSDSDSLREPLSIVHSEEFETKLRKYPLKRLFFITIRCPTQKSRWIKIGKVNDWIRRYSKTYFIVKGIEGGVHFHLLAGIEKKKVLKPQKGIHFYIKPLASKSEISVDYKQLEEDTRKARYMAASKRDELMLSASIDCQCVVSQISAMIKSYWLRQRAKASSARRKAQVVDAIDSVINYLYKNLSENGDDPTIYEDYIEQY